MIIRYGFAFLLLFVVGCQSFALMRPKALEPDLRKEFQQAMLFLKEHEYQKAAQVYLGIAKEYPRHPRAEEAGILGQELQKLVSLTQSLSVSKESALKDLKEMTQEFKQLSDQNAKLEKFENDNLVLRSELRKLEEHLKGLEGLEKENRRLQSDIDRLTQSLKEFHKIEQDMKRPLEPPQRPQGSNP
jgi:TolA-binding protein